MQKTVRLLKASAGTGKTHNLTGEYIRFLLEGDDEFSYKHILAVTFTNKATEEMKSRIIMELNEMSGDSSNADAQKARRRLTRLLNDYNCFSISTIDRFFQMVMRSFAREIGKYASYKVELDTDLVVSQAVDMLLDSLDGVDNSDLMEWLKEYSFRKVEEGGNWNISGPLFEMAKLFFKEEFIIHKKETGSLLADKVKLASLDRKLRQVQNSFKQRAKAIGINALKIMSDEGVQPEDFKGKSRGPFMIFKTLAKGEIKMPSEKLNESFAGHDIPALRLAVDDIQTLFAEEYDDFVTAQLIGNNLYLLGIYSDIFRHLDSYLKENNVVLLSESSDILNRIIDGSDTPFVYEKIGTRFDHILLDEAQDTSLLQWKNFMPLFTNNISQGLQNLVVGDIKQSIYRWRGSDWRLMSEYIYNDLKRDNIDDTDPLVENWRSCRNVIDFNTRVFSQIESYVPLGGIYSDYKQKQASRNASWPEGRVKVGFIEGPQWKQAALEKVLDDINNLVDAGYRYDDITVLVRKNDEGALAAAFLMENKISVITEDSLHIEASACIARVLDILRYYVNPLDPVNEMLVGDIKEDAMALMAEGSLYEICQGLLRSGLFQLQACDIPFVHAFLDCVISYQEKYGSSIRGFLKWWEESGSSRSICAPSGQNAVRIMTIHKSKGLGLEAVIIPFMEEKFGGHPDVLWMKASGKFSELGIVPVRASDRMRNSIFRDQYENELLMTKTDSVNTAYVALTRPVSQLVIYSPRPAKEDDYKLNSFANLLFSILKKELDGNGIFTVGKIEKVSSGTINGSGMVQDEYFMADAGKRLKLSLRGGDYFEVECSPRMRGIELHDILSKIDRLEDLEVACGNDKESFHYLKEHLSHVDSYHWFDGTYRSMNESSIIDGDGSVFRPDRILLDGKGNAVVVDYKFGASRKKYNEQVKEYAKMLYGMGFARVDSYLWYVGNNIVEKVE